MYVNVALALIAGGGASSHWIELSAVYLAARLLAEPAMQCMSRHGPAVCQRGARTACRRRRCVKRAQCTSPTGLAFAFFGSGEAVALPAAHGARPVVMAERLRASAYHARNVRNAQAAALGTNPT